SGLDTSHRHGFLLRGSNRNCRRLVPGPQSFAPGPDRGPPLRVSGTRPKRINTERPSRELDFLAFSLRPSRLRGESAVPHSPPKRRERKESAKKNSFQASKNFQLSSTARHSCKPVKGYRIWAAKIRRIRVNQRAI